MSLSRRPLGASNFTIRALNVIPGGGCVRVHMCVHARYVLCVHTRVPVCAEIKVFAALLAVGPT